MTAFDALLWGLLTASSLLIGAALAIWMRPSNRAIGLIMGFGSGALISAVAYELAPEAVAGNTLTAFWLAIGALTFFAGDLLIDRRGGAQRKSIASGSVGGSGQAIFLGTLLDGVPECLVLGMGLALGGSIGLSFVVAVFVSNLPEAMAATSGMIESGRSRRTILGLWLGLCAGSGLAAALGFTLVTWLPSVDGSAAEAFAAGAMLTMLADTMIPEAYEHGGRVVGLVTVLGFTMAAALTFAS